MLLFKNYLAVCLRMVWHLQLHVLFAVPQKSCRFFVQYNLPGPRWKKLIPRKPSSLALCLISLVLHQLYQQLFQTFPNSQSLKLCLLDLPITSLIENRQGKYECIKEIKAK